MACRADMFELFLEPNDVFGILVDFGLTVYLGYSRRLYIFDINVNKKVQKQ